MRLLCTLLRNVRALDPLARSTSTAMVAITLVLASGCTNKPETSKITIKLPAVVEGVTAKNSKVISRSAVGALSSQWSYTSPTAMNQVKCYAVAVETPGVGTPGSCTTLAGTRVLTPMLMYGPVAGSSTLTVEVPTGPSRKIALIAFAADTVADCARRVGTSPDPAMLSAPHVVGSVEMDLYEGENDVKMTASMTGATALESCTHWSTTAVVPTPTATPIPSPTPMSLANSSVSLSSSSVASGASITLNLTVRDAGNNVMTGASGHTVAFTQTGSGTGTISAVTYAGAGVYTATFTGVVAGGPTDIGATIDGVAVTSTKPDVSVTPGTVSLSASTVTASGASVLSANSISVTLTAKDDAGNTLTGGGLSVGFGNTGGVSTGSFSSVIDNGNGTYTTWFTGLTSGTATTLTATVGGGNVTSAMPSVTVQPGAYSLSASTISVSSATVASSATVTVTLTMKDSNDNLTPAATGRTVVFSHAGGDSTGSFTAATDNGNGTYSSTFTGTLAGTPTYVYAIVNGAAVTSGSPSITVNPGLISMANSTLSIGTTSIQYKAATPFTLVARDSNSNLITTGLTLANFSVTQGLGSSTITPSGFTNNSDGTYTTTLTGDGLGTARALRIAYNGTSSADSKTVGVIPMNLSVAPLYPTYGSDWNEYVSYSDAGQPIWNQADVACSGSENGYYGEPNGCFHAGEMRRVTVSGFTSCTNLTAQDALGVFKWKCAVIGGTANFYSEVLPTKGLRELVSATAWNNNSVIVRESGTIIGQSSSTTWWSNVVQAIPTSSSTRLDLSTTGTVYTVTAFATASNGYRITAPGIAIVTLAPSGSIARSSASGNNFLAGDCYAGSPAGIMLICSDQNYLWIEAQMDGTAAFRPATAVRLGFSKFSRIHRTKITTMDTASTMASIELTGAGQNLVSEGYTYGSGTAGGLRISGSSNIVKGFSAGKSQNASSVSHLMWLTSSSSANRLYDIKLANLDSPTGGYGLVIEGSNHVVNGVNVSNIKNDSGIYLTNTSGLILTNVVATALGDAGIEFDGGSAISDTIVRDVTVTNAAWNAVYVRQSVDAFVHNLVSFNVDTAIQSEVSTGAGTLTFYNVFAAANGSTEAVDHYGNQSMSFLGFFDRGGTAATCSGTFIDVSATCQIGATVYTSATSNLFVGKVVTDDVANLGDTNGTATLAGLNYWTTFDNFHRAWGVQDANAFPNVSHRGACIGTNCQIWDWRPHASGLLLNRARLPNSAMTTFTGGSACPTEVAGSQAHVRFGKTFLKYAIEINGDFVGNDNGLCESNEACTYAPHRGAWQGEGNHLTLGTCTFSDGTVSGVTMYAYPP